MGASPYFFFTFVLLSKRLQTVEISVNTDLKKEHAIMLFTRVIIRYSMNKGHLPKKTYQAILNSITGKKKVGHALCIMSG